MDIKKSALTLLPWKPSGCGNRKVWINFFSHFRWKLSVLCRCYCFDVVGLKTRRENFSRLDKDKLKRRGILFVATTQPGKICRTEIELGNSESCLLFHSSYVVFFCWIVVCCFFFLVLESLRKLNLIDVDDVNYQFNAWRL